MVKSFEDTSRQEAEIEYIRERVLRKFPRLGVTMAGLKTVAVKTVKTAATDGKTVYYSPKFFETLSDEEKMFVYAHEVMHVAFNHILRSKDRDHKLWNIATDAVINQMLKSEGLPLVQKGVNMEEAIHHSAEEMYEKLLKEKQQKGQNQKSKGQKEGKESSEKDDDSQPQDNFPTNDQSAQNESASKDQRSTQTDSEDENEQVGHDSHEIWKEAVQQAEQQKNSSNKQAGDSLTDKIKRFFEGKERQKSNEGEQQSPSSAQDMNEMEKNFSDENKKEREEKARAVRELLERKKNEHLAAQMQKGGYAFGKVGESDAALDWKRLLKKTLEKEEDQWSYRRSDAENDYMARVETLDAEEESETEVMLDVSGSVDDQLLKEFLRQLKPILKTSKLKVGCFDEYFYGLTEIKKTEDIDNFKIISKSGWTENWDLAVKSFSKKKEVNKIVFTDGYPCPGTMPTPETKNMNVIWLVYGNRDFHPICGKVIYLDPAQVKQHLLIKNPLSSRDR